MKRIIAVIISLCVLLSVMSAGATAFAKDNANTTASESAKREISEKKRNRYYKTAAFVGNSVGLGQNYYFDRQGKNFLGKPTMLVRGCYSFYNDKHARAKWMVRYNGKPMKAKNAIKAAGVDKVFINMGTNDFFYNGDRVFEDYREYIRGIRKVNPDVIIFIESTTGVTASHQGKCLNSKNIARLNELMEEYCKEHKDLYFIDVSSKMLNKKGHLKYEYASDNYCHLTDSAYKIWTEQMIKFTDKLMLREEDATKAVKKAEKKRTKKAVKQAKKLVKKLEKSTVKSELNKRIKAIEIKD